MNILEQLNNSRYSTQAEWAADIATSEYANNPEFRNAVDNKLRKSFATMSGVQSAPMETRSMSYQKLPDGFAVGEASVVANARNNTLQQIEEDKQRASTSTGNGYQNLRIGK